MRSAEEILRSIVTDVEAMRCEAPFDIRKDLPEESKDWFGGFEQTGLMDDRETPIFQWPNLSILVDEAKQLDKPTLRECLAEAWALGAAHNKPSIETLNTWREVLTKGVC